MNTKLKIRASFLQAALVTAAEKDIRYYLNGVLLDIFPGAVRIVSTDGHRLSVFHCAYTPEEGEPAELPRAQIIIDRNVLKGLKPAKGESFVTMEFDAESPLGECRLSGLKGPDVVFKPTDAKYPDYTRIMPQSCPNGEPAHFNPEYIYDFARMREMITGKSGIYPPSVYTQGTGTAAVMLPGVPEFYGAVMPMRWDMPAWECPEWLAPQGEQEMRKAA